MQCIPGQAGRVRGHLAFLAVSCAFALSCSGRVGPAGSSGGSAGVGGATANGDAAAANTGGSAGASCARLQGTISSCSFKDTCRTQLVSCGSVSSPYTATGCLRTLGNPCLKDTDCPANQMCAWPAQDVSWTCSYDTSGTCQCAGKDNGFAGPKGACVNR